MRLSWGRLSAAIMDTAFILLKTEPGREKDVYSALSSIAEVRETHALYGEYDLLALIECDNSKDLTSIIMGKMRQIGGVKETETLIAVDY